LRDSPWRGVAALAAPGQLIGLLCAPASAAAQEWPLRPVTMVVSLAAGGAANITGE
jgi:tripartite-type tricarboxylate transporter receptor subunit TctC